MRTKNSADVPAPHGSAAAHAPEHPWRGALPYVALAVAVLLSYGYEIFSFNLTIDEELHAVGAVHLDVWIAQGRWSMALLNYVLLANPVGPVTSTLIGVLAGALGLLLLLRKMFALDEPGAAAIAALAITTPTLAFIFTFSTIAYGVGVAFLTLALSISVAARYSLHGLLLACLLGAFSIGVYQPFVFAVAILAAVSALRPLHGTRFSTLRRYGCWFAYVIGSVLIYGVASLLAMKLRSVHTQYVGAFVDIAGLFQQPRARLQSSFWQLIDILRLDRALFGLSSIWLGVTVSAAAVLALLNPLMRNDQRQLARNAGVMLTVVAAIVLAAAVSGYVLPLRAVVYFPIGVAVVAAIGYSESKPRLRMLFLVLCGLAVVGNAAINNHLFASAAATEFQDRLLAHEIVRTVRGAYPDLAKAPTPVKVVTVGTLGWPETPLRPVRDTFGASFFEWGGGLDERIAAYLTLNGLKSIGSTGRDRVRIFQSEADMPAWPRDGWIRLSGDTLVLKLGDYSPAQRADLCMMGYRSMCQ